MPRQLVAFHPRLSPSLTRVPLAAGDGFPHPAPSVPASPPCFRLSSDKPFHIFIFKSFTETASRSGLAPVPQPRSLGAPVPRTPQRPQEPTETHRCGTPRPPSSSPGSERPAPGLPSGQGTLRAGNLAKRPRDANKDPLGLRRPHLPPRHLRAARASEGGKNPSARYNRFTAVLLRIRVSLRPEEKVRWQPQVPSRWRRDGHKYKFWCLSKAMVLIEQHPGSYFYKFSSNLCNSKSKRFCVCEPSHPELFSTILLLIYGEQKRLCFLYLFSHSSKHSLRQQPYSKNTRYSYSFLLLN